MRYRQTMPKMKHLLRKLHIGGSVTEHHSRVGEIRQTNSPSPSLSPSPSSVPSSPNLPPTAANPETRAIEAVERTTSRADHVDGAVDFNFFEEEFQVQLALAISASDPDGRGDAESAQIKAAKELSLGCPPSGAVEFLSLRYWNNNVVNYDEEVMDGFYDVYGINPNSTMQGKMPLLVDLQATTISANADYEVILVNRIVDPALQQLERKVESLAVECRASDLGPIVSGLVQKIADLVVDTMGGPVGDADEMLRRWKVRSYELRSSLNDVILPLGCLNIGLSRHRALLFKVLADRISLPCRLVKGSYYTGTDEGAVNLIKIDFNSEYIIDLMGAPGTLIPAEIPSNHFQNFGLDAMSSLTIEHTGMDSCFALDQASHQSDNKTGKLGDSLFDLDLDLAPRVVGSGSNKAAILGFQSKGNEVNLVERNQTERFEHEFGKLLPSLRRSNESSPGVSGKASPAQKMQLKDVSKYVITAAQNPDFAQKLHAVLLESRASASPDMFSDIALPWNLGEQNGLVQSCSEEEEKMDGGSQQHCADPLQRELENPGTGGFQFSQGNEGNSGKPETGGIICLTENQERADGSMMKFVEAYNHDTHIAHYSHNERINPMIDEVAEWEIPWEDIQIGERIGLGSYGEVYRADWNGTEVAVKKFLDQDFSGDALEQLRCEVRIMQRMRHPNIVLFMGAVTRPPNLSILTEFLPRGSLCKLLHRPNIHLDEKRRLRMALDVAKGMNYLHTCNPTIVHRDLKSPNLLVDKNWIVKVCDFGLSRLKHHTFLSSKSMAGTAEWMAPEVLRNEPSNEKCDVFSFGVILWELATLRMPWSGMNSMQVVGAVGFQNRRLEIPEEIDPVVAQIIRDCWQSEPHLRPSFSQLMSLLKHLQRLVVERR